MAHSNTAFDKAQIDSIAGRHDAMVQEVESRLSTLRGNIQATAAGASSDMTRALMQVNDQWSANVKKVVLENITAMSAAMRAEGNNQEVADSDNTRQIMNTVSPVGSFLGG